MLINTYTYNHTYNTLSFGFYCLNEIQGTWFLILKIFDESVSPLWQVCNIGRGEEEKYSSWILFVCELEPGTTPSGSKVKLCLQHYLVTTLSILGN